MRMEARRLDQAIRPAAAAGHFYPSEPGLLRTMVDNLLNGARAASVTGGPPPKALIVPHAGYIYSGLIAASAYVRLETAFPLVRRVVLLGPAHRVGFYGIAAPEADCFETPLGYVAVDEASVEQACTLPTVFRYENAHAPEHSLEVQLPFLQRVIGDDFSLVPLVVGSAQATDVARVLSLLWGGPETLIVVSSDLSHHLDYHSAREVDERTSAAIESFNEEAIAPGLACGRLPIQGLLQIARQKGLRARRLDLRSSGDTAGPRERVVGYGAFEFS
ncbi:AmmeMemoRadiSam system protein B [Thioalkalivibrio denitrificans]|uniref:MEMO1 family protein B1C78_07910 n=1 Tax=Thioalkalivibrio denitrificans TaxID=108003 RepID=A0A1V3NI38_9GAMM|nr:AmmeMemoRadiSam system protein B [Thioalkalivibrio denitrificans]OOG24741.1 AmmeMemoRadiSam system protein B [Thioalkalivibrio denitrificans]